MPSASPTFLRRERAIPSLSERLAVQPQDLRRRLDPATLPFRTTAEVAPVKTTIGQPRAAEAIAFALEVDARGFHLYAAGSPCTGRETTILAAVSVPEALDVDLARPGTLIVDDSYPPAFSLGKAVRRAAQPRGMRPRSTGATNRFATAAAC